MLTKSDIAGGSSKFVALMFIFARTEDLSCRYFKNSLLPMPNSWANCGNVVNVLDLKIWLMWVIPFSAHVRKFSIFLLLIKSRLFHRGVRLDGASIEFVIW